MGSTYGSITPAQKEFVETWQNVASYQNGVIKLDIRGDEKQEIVQGDREFYITTEERLLTQAKILDKANDPFRNGAFRPVVVPDDVTIETNPNALSDEEIMGIFEASDFAWTEWMAVIDSPATLNRMIDLADQAENLTVRRLREVQLRLREVKPQTRLTHSDEQLQKFLDEGTRTQTSQQERDARPRGQGGRSAAYRSS